MPSVDVVIPCYNYARYLRRCVQTVLSQSGVDVRILIIDDASTDDTPDVGASLALSDRRVEYRRHVRNMRHIATYNEGLIDWATAEYSLLLSADDLLAPGALGRAVAVMNAHPDAHMTYGMSLLFFDDSEIVDQTVTACAGAAAGSTHRLVTGADFLRRAIIGNPVPTPTAVVRTAVQKRVGGYSSSLPHTADLAMWMNFAAFGAIGVVSDVQAYKRIHSSNMSLDYCDRSLGDLRERLDAYRHVLTQHGSALGRDAPTMDEVNRLVAEQAFWTASRLVDGGHDLAAREALAFAVEIHPPIRGNRAWRRLQMKRALPAGLWRTLYPVLSTLRGIRDVGESNNFLKPTWSSRQQVGWWPG